MSTDETRSLPEDQSNRSSSSSRERRLDDAIAAYLGAIGSGSSPDPQPWLERYPDLSAELKAFFADHQRLERLAQPVRAATAANLPAGSRVHYVGDYELLRELGRGGMGLVYEARQVSLNRLVAVKMILAGELATPGEVERFYAEARTAATLQHPNIVALHEVGQHEGQHYFSMDYVAGKSLAEIVREQPLTPERAARYVKAVAEAIHHAHEQGILHRDLKPSNVLIDRFDQPRVTDFGLAKRVTGDDPRTATGAVLGTPSYMPPEQASSDRGEVGPASDVYSLGATLYELVTGRPPFRAATMLDTLLQVREAEPALPRLLNPAVNRDLETIILKCLAKESSGRYPSAKELADDLGRFVRDEPIHARRPGPLERAWRWAKSHRGTAATIAATAIAVLLVLQGAALYRYLGQGGIRLQTDAADMSAQFLDLNNRTVAPPFRVPTEQVLPAGRYGLRVSMPGLPSETWPLDVERWSGQSHTVKLRSRMLWPPLECSLTTQRFLLAESDRTDLLLLDPASKRLRRIHGGTGQPLWPRDLVFDASVPPPAGQEAAWSSLLQASAWQADTRSSDALAPWAARVILPAPDLNGDGTSDIVLAFPRQGLLLAISGREGSRLWLHAGDERQTIIGGEGIVHSDGDNVPDVALCLWKHPVAEIRVVSGKDGQKLWSYPLDEAWLGEPPRGESPLFNSGTIQPQAAIVGDAPAVVFLAGSKLAALDARSGKNLWPPNDLGLALFCPPHRADFDGDGAGDLLLYGQRLEHFDAPFGIDSKHAPASERQPQLAVVSLHPPRVLWQEPVPTSRYQANWYQLNFGDHSSVGEMPQVVDLDADGRAEVLTAIGTRNYDSSGQPPWSGIAIWDGVTGRPRWQRRLTSPIHGGAHHSDMPITYFLAGPDTSGDGFREILVPWASFDDEARSRALTIACLSGDDGRPLWIEKSFQADNPNAMPFLRGAGDDGWPQLVVPQGSTATIHALSDGRLQELVSAVQDLTAADLNDDGSPELIYSVQPQGAARILAIAGRPAETWRQLGGFKLAEDFDGDLAPDLLDDSRRGVLAAHRGSDGRKLWEKRAEFWEPQSAITAPLPHGDLDGDGVADVVGFGGETEGLSGGMVLHTVAAFSGKSGRHLWTSGNLQSGGSGGSGTSREVSLPHLAWHDLDGDRRGEILLVQRRRLQGNESHPLELVVLAGGDGRRLWQTNISEIHLDRTPGLVDGSHDLNGDGADDLVLWVPLPESPRWEGAENLCAFSGKDGQMLWTVEPGGAEKRTSLRPPVIDDVDRDGTPDVLAMRYSLSQQEPETILVKGRTGEIQWRWTSQILDSSVQPPLVAQLAADGSKTILIETPAFPDWQVTLLSAAGQVRRQLPMRPRWHAALEAGWLAADLTGDGRQEVLVVIDDKLRALQGDDLHLLWEQPLGDAARVLQIMPAQTGQAATVVLSSGGEVLGLDGQTAKPRWKCDLGPGASAVGLLHAKNSEPRSPPQVVFHEPGGWATICRQALTVGADGKVRRPAPPPIVPSAAADLSLSRPLPWYLTGSYQQQVAPLAAWNDMTRTYFLEGDVPPRIFFSPAAVFVILLVVPWILWKLQRRNIPRIRAITATYAIVICGPYLAWLLFSLVLIHPIMLVLYPLVVLATGLMSIPYLLFARHLWQSLERRQWWQAALLLGGSLVLAAALAAVLLRMDAAVKLPDERYQLAGWYLIWFQTIYALGLVLLAIAICRWIVARFRRRFGKSTAVAIKAAA